MSPTFFSTSKSEEDKEEEDKEEHKEEEVKKKKKTMTLMIKVKNVLIIAEFVGHANNPSGVSSSSRRSLFFSLLLLKSLLQTRIPRTSKLPTRILAKERECISMPRENPATCRDVQCPDHVLKAIYSQQHIVEVSESDESHSKRVVIDDELRRKKLEEYDENLKKWWEEYAARKNSEDEEHVCDSLLYDFSHLPRTTPAPNFLEDRVVKTLGAKEVVHKTTTEATGTQTTTGK